MMVDQEQDKSSQKRVIRDWNAHLLELNLGDDLRFNLMITHSRAPSFNVCCVDPNYAKAYLWDNCDSFFSESSQYTVQ